MGERVGGVFGGFQGTEPGQGSGDLGDLAGEIGGGDEVAAGSEVGGGFQVGVAETVPGGVTAGAAVLSYGV